MQDNLTRQLAGWPEQIAKAAVLSVLRPICDRLSSQPLATAGLVIKAGGGILTKIGATAYHGIVKGKLVTIAAATDMPALTGLVITANKYNVAAFFIDSASTVTMRYGVEGTARADVKFPPIPEGQALVGFLIITHSATFTGGTTALDTATTQYVSPVGPFDPTLVLG